MIRRVFFPVVGKQKIISGGSGAAYGIAMVANLEVTDFFAQIHAIIDGAQPIVSRVIRISDLVRNDVMRFRRVSHFV